MIIGFPEEEGRKKGAESIFEDIIAENSPNLGMETDIQSRKRRQSQRESTQRRSHQDTGKLKGQRSKIRGEYYNQQGKSNIQGNSQ